MSFIFIIMVVVDVEDLPIGKVRWSIFVLTILLLLDYIDGETFKEMISNITDDDRLIKRIVLTAYRFISSKNRKYFSINIRKMKKWKSLAFI